MGLSAYERVSTDRFKVLSRNGKRKGAEMGSFVGKSSKNVIC
jgi:hypothetical protein